MSSSRGRDRRLLSGAKIRHGSFREPQVVTRLQSPEAPSSDFWQVLNRAVRRAQHRRRGGFPWWLVFGVFPMDMPPKDMKQTTIFFLGLTVEMRKISKWALICSDFSLIGWVTDHSENLAAEFWRWQDPAYRIHQNPR